MDDRNALELADHERYMRRCIELALQAQSRGNTPVGSLVVANGDIVGEGIEELSGGNNLTGHAEVIACQSAVDHLGSVRLEGATLYTTAEPCFMCAYVIRQCGITLVVYGVETAMIGGITSHHPILTDTLLSEWKPAPRILAGVLQDECQRLRPEGRKT